MKSRMLAPEMSSNNTTKFSNSLPGEHAVGTFSEPEFNLNEMTPLLDFDGGYSPEIDGPIHDNILNELNNRIKILDSVIIE
jgi:hypothetical protein